MQNRLTFYFIGILFCYSIFARGQSTTDTAYVSSNDDRIVIRKSKSRLTTKPDSKKNVIASKVSNDRPFKAEFSRQVIIDQIPKTVPPGKIWKLERDTPTLVEVSEGTLNSRNACNGWFLSNPGFIHNVCIGNPLNPECFRVIISDFEKVHYTNQYTFRISPVSFINAEFRMDQLREKSARNVGMGELVFVPGEVVFVNNCLQSIQFTEYHISKEGLLKEIEKIEMQRSNYAQPQIFKAR